MELQGLNAIAHAVYAWAIVRAIFMSREEEKSELRFDRPTYFLVRRPRLSMPHCCSILRRSAGVRL
jgi:hypothetical protein